MAHSNMTSTQHVPHWRQPALVASETKAGDRVLCTGGAGTGFLRRGREYVIAQVTPSGYVRVEGSADYYHAAARFTPIVKTTRSDA